MPPFSRPLPPVLLGYLQAFHYSALIGIPLLLMRPEKGNLNALCADERLSATVAATGGGFFTCGFPSVHEKTVRELGFSRYNIKPDAAEYRRMRTNSSGEPFKMVQYRSNKDITTCFRDGFDSKDRPESPYSPKGVTARTCTHPEAVPPPPHRHRTATAPPLGIEPARTPLQRGAPAASALAPPLCGDFAPPLCGDLASPLGSGACNWKRNHAAAGCWQMKALQALLPRFSPSTVQRLPDLQRLYRGNFGKVGRTPPKAGCVRCCTAL